MSPELARYYERWALVEHLESALRLTLARRLGAVGGHRRVHLKEPLSPAG